jgi:DNA-binding MarR family transcriptional regulator
MKWRRRHDKQIRTMGIMPELPIVLRPANQPTDCRVMPLPHPSIPADFSDLQSLYDRPGFMIRRAHQIAQKLFLEESGGITTTQYGVMRILGAQPGLDQIGVARLLGQDHSTTALVIGKLAEDGLVERKDGTDDRRRKILALTPKGCVLLREVGEAVRRSNDRLMLAFGAEEAGQFLALLRKFVEAFNSVAPTPLETKRKPGR